MLLMLFLLLSMLSEVTNQLLEKPVTLLMTSLNKLVPTPQVVFNPYIMGTKCSNPDTTYADPNFQVAQENGVTGVSDAGTFVLSETALNMPAEGTKPCCNCQITT